MVKIKVLARCMPQVASLAQDCEMTMVSEVLRGNILYLSFEALSKEKDRILVSEELFIEEVVRRPNMALQGVGHI